MICSIRALSSQASSHRRWWASSWAPSIWIWSLDPDRSHFKKKKSKNLNKRRSGFVYDSDLDEGFSLATKKWDWERSWWSGNWHRFYELWIHHNSHHLWRSISIKLWIMEISVDLCGDLIWSSDLHPFFFHFSFFIFVLFLLYKYLKFFCFSFYSVDTWHGLYLKTKITLLSLTLTNVRLTEEPNWWVFENIGTKPVKNGKTVKKTYNSKKHRDSNDNIPLNLKVYKILIFFLFFFKI